MSAWKNFERYVASIFNTTRNALSGGNSKMTRSDSLHSDLFISCKYTKSNHARLRALVAEERKKAKAEGKIAVTVIGEAGDRSNAIVVLHLQDLYEFQRLIRIGEVFINEA